MKKRKLAIILWHVLIWLLLSVLCVVLAEPLITLIWPETHHVGYWIAFVQSGLFIVFIGTLFSLVAKLNRKSI